MPYRTGVNEPRSDNNQPPVRQAHGPEVLEGKKFPLMGIGSRQDGIRLDYFCRIGVKSSVVDAAGLHSVDLQSCIYYSRRINRPTKAIIKEGLYYGSDSSFSNPYGKQREAG